MAIQRITHKKIVKYDTKNPNFNPESLKKPKKEVSGNVQEDTDVYGNGWGDNNLSDESQAIIIHPS